MRVVEGWTENTWVRDMVPPALLGSQDYTCASLCPLLINIVRLFKFMVTHNYFPILLFSVEAILTVLHL